MNGPPFVLRAGFSAAAHDAGVPSATSSSPPEMQTHARPPLMTDADRTSTGTAAYVVGALVASGVQRISVSHFG